MGIFDMVFLLVALATVVTLAGAGIAAAAGQRAGARRALRRLGIGAGAYALIVLATSAMAPRRLVHMGQPMCFDDWCIRVDSVERGPTRTTVNFSILSAAKRVTQRERGLAVYLEDSSGRRLSPVSDPKEVPFDRAVGPGDSFHATRRYAVPADQPIVGVAVRHTGFPIDWFIIGSGPLRLPPLADFGQPQLVRGVGWLRR